MNAFAASAATIAARVTDVPEERCAVSGVFFDHIALVDVVVSSCSILIPPQTRSLQELLIGYGSECFVVSLIFGEPARLERSQLLSDGSELENLLPEVRNDPGAVAVYNRHAVHSFMVVGRNDPVIPREWAVLGGVVLDKGLGTLRRNVQPLALDDVWRLWRLGKWGDPEPAEDAVAAEFSKHYRGLLADGGWSILTSGEVEPLQSDDEQ